ncbi:MAG TPA: AAA family ATPase [Gemmatimonadales bacterium]
MTAESGYSILVVTGASGAGKTTLVQALADRRLPGVHCYFFDSIGVPSVERMIAEFGSPEAWQTAMTGDWVRRLAANPDRARLAVLDGQVRPSAVRAAFLEHRVARGEILLLDCSHEVRDARLRQQRQHPELASRNMTAWAAYLRGQADALGLPILDTTHLNIAEASDRLVQHIQGVE